VTAKAVLSLLFLTALSVVAMLGFRALPHRVGGTAAGVETLVAATVLPAGTLLTAKDVAWRPIAATAQPDQIIRPASGDNHGSAFDQLPAAVYGAALRNALGMGEPVTRAFIVKPGDRDFLQVVLSPRARAIAIPVSTGGASTGILSPGDRVDVMLTQTFKNDPSPARRSVGETVVENLRVLAIDPLDAKAAATGGNGFGRTVTLEVTPEQAEKISVAGELGKLSLTLRSLSANGGIPVPTIGSDEAAGIKAVWAGDVSPALGNSMPPNRAISPEPPQVEIIRGTKVVSMKPQ
jgi:pilus assembly protein CpaB